MRPSASGVCPAQNRFAVSLYGTWVNVRATGSQTRGLVPLSVALSKIRSLPFGSMLVWIGTIGSVVGAAPLAHLRRVGAAVRDGDAHRSRGRLAACGVARDRGQHVRAVPPQAWCPTPIVYGAVSPRRRAAPVEPELNAVDADVVGSIRPQDSDVAETVVPLAGAVIATVGRGRVGRIDDIREMHRNSVGARRSCCGLRGPASRSVCGSRHGRRGGVRAVEREIDLDEVVVYLEVDVIDPGEIAGRRVQRR